MTALLPAAANLAELRARFRWEIPDSYNMAVAVCDRWAARHPHQVAIIYAPGERGDGNAVTTITYQQLRAQSNQLANLLTHLGVAAGDRIGILLPQHPYTAVAHIAAWKMAAISIPLFMLFGEEALCHRLEDSAAKIVITNRLGAARLGDLRGQLPALTQLLCIDGAVGGALDLPAALSAARRDFTVAITTADTPALIIYTSGTTGQPKGALQAHRSLLGHLPGVEMSHNLLPQPGDKIWTPADWAWIGGLMDVLMPALYHGVPIVAKPSEKFVGAEAIAFINRHSIRNVFLPPTALKMMRMAMVADTSCRVTAPLRSIASAGEALGAELLAWGKTELGLAINEFYGQTECNMIVSACAALAEPQAGVMGTPVPGHEVSVIDSTGQPLGVGAIGQIAVRAPDPVMFLNYWNNATATRAKYLGEWLLTGDSGVLTSDGALRFIGREDDVITTAGYRVGPGEIENCLLGHPAVAIAAVVGKPDPTRTEIVKAFIKLNPGVAATAQLQRELQQWVKTRLAAHEYPREIAFIDTFPLTTTGKIIRRELRELG